MADLFELPPELQHLIEKRQKPERRTQQRRKTSADVPPARDRRRGERRTAPRRSKDQAP